MPANVAYVTRENTPLFYRIDEALLPGGQDEDDGPDRDGVLATPRTASRGASPLSLARSAQPTATTVPGDQTHPKPTPRSPRAAKVWCGPGVVSPAAPFQNPRCVEAKDKVGFAASAASTASPCQGTPISSPRTLSSSAPIYQDTPSDHTLTQACGCPDARSGMHGPSPAGLAAPTRIMGPRSQSAGSLLQGQLMASTPASSSSLCTSVQTALVSSAKALAATEAPLPSHATVLCATWEGPDERPPVLAHSLPVTRGVDAGQSGPPPTAPSSCCSPAVPPPRPLADAAPQRIIAPAAPRAQRSPPPVFRATVVSGAQTHVPCHTRASVAWKMQCPFPGPPQASVTPRAQSPSLGSRVVRQPVWSALCATRQGCYPSALAQHQQPFGTALGLASCAPPAFAGPAQCWRATETPCSDESTGLLLMSSSSRPAKAASRAARSPEASAHNRPSSTGRRRFLI